MAMANEEEETKQSRYKKCGLLMERALMAKRGPTTPVAGWRTFFQESGNRGGQLTTRPDIVFSARKLGAALWEVQEIPPFTDLSSHASFPRQLPDETDFHIVLPSSPSISCNRSRRPLKYASHQHSSKSREPLDACDDKTSRIFLEGTERSSKLLKVLSRAHNLEECNTSSKVLVTALQEELEHAWAQVQDFALAYRALCKEINEVLKKSAEDRAIWHRKAKERTRLATQSLKKDLEEERKSKRQLEIINSRLRRELSEANLSLSRALKDLKKETKARELMENVCDELAQEIGEGKAEVEELRVSSAKVKEEIEEERTMLQMAEVLREERVQMKLSDARLQLQERNSALDRLKSELEEFLGSTKVLTGGTDAWGERDIRKGTDLQAAVDAIHRQGKRESFHEAWQMDGPSFMEDDLHSIDLSKETQYSRDLNWKTGHSENNFQAIKAKQKFPCKSDDNVKEHKAARRTRIVNRAKHFALSRSSGWTEEPRTAKPPAANANQCRGTVPEKVGQGSDFRCFEGWALTSNSDQDNEFSRVNLKCEGSPTSAVEENLPSERSQSNRLMTMHQARDADYRLNDDTFAWGLDFSTGDETSGDDSTVQSQDRKSLNLNGEHSVTISKNRACGNLTLTSLSPEKPKIVHQKNSNSMTRIRQHAGRSKTIQRKQLTRVYMKNRKVS